MSENVGQFIGVVQIALAIITLIFGRSILEWYTALRKPIRIACVSKYNYNQESSHDFGWDVYISSSKEVSLTEPIYLYFDQMEAAMFGISTVRGENKGTDVNAIRKSSGLCEIMVNFLPPNTTINFSFYCLPASRPLFGFGKSRPPFIVHYGRAAAPYTRELLVAHVRILVILLLFAQAMLASLARILILGIGS